MFGAGEGGMISGIAKFDQVSGAQFQNLVEALADRLYRADGGRDNPHARTRAQCRLDALLALVGLEPAPPPGPEPSDATPGIEPASPAAPRPTLPGTAQPALPSAGEPARSGAARSDLPSVGESARSGAARSDLPSVGESARSGAARSSLPGAAHRNGSSEKPGGKDRSELWTPDLALHPEPVVSPPPGSGPGTQSGTGENPIPGEVSGLGPPPGLGPGLRSAAGCSCGPGFGPKAQLCIVMDLEYLATDGERGRCEIPGVGALARSELERLSCDAEIYGLIFDRRGVPLYHGRRTRRVSPQQWRTLVARDRGCVICGAAPSLCQAHHVKYWALGGRTDIDNLALVCHLHHRWIHDNRIILRWGSDGWRAPPGPAPPSLTTRRPGPALQPA